MKYLALLLGLALFYGLSLMKKKGASFSSRVILGSLLGLGLGLVSRVKLNFLGFLEKFTLICSSP